MTVPRETEAEIRRLFLAEHWKCGTIAAQLGVHPDVVTRVIGSLGPKPRTPSSRSLILDPFTPFVDETLAMYRNPCTSGV